MCDFELKQWLKKKRIILTFLIVCSLFISDKALAVWDKKCCKVRFIPGKENRIKIDFKFFEYDFIYAPVNYFLENFEVKYSTDFGKTYIHLLSASTEYQSTDDWAWIDFKNKQAGSKIDLTLHPRDLRPKYTSTNWKDGTNRRLEVCNDLVYENETWVGINWFLNKGAQNNTTHIRILAAWYNPGIMIPNEHADLVYKITPKGGRLKSSSLNVSNSMQEQEIGNEAQSYSVMAYKDANAIIVNGSLGEKIQVYTNAGALVKSMVADCDVLQIPLPANQLYIVHVGQGRYKLAL